jgi:hypothetical protein
MKQTFKCKECKVDYESVPEEFVDTAEFATDFRLLGLDLANEPDFIYQDFGGIKK